MLLTLAAAALAATPQPGEIRTFRDWMVGCDNRRHCQAVALADAGEPVLATMSVVRAPEAAAAPEIRIASWEKKPAAAIVGGQRFPLKPLGRGEDEAEYAPADPLGFLAALLKADKALLVEASGAPAGELSASGATAALLYMDEQQRRAGTVTALAGRGGRPASSVPPPPQQPVIVSAPPARRPEGPKLSAAELQRLMKQTQCEGEDSPESQRAYESHTLDAAHSLIMLPCGAGAYNLMSAPILATRKGGRLAFAPAPFDLSPDEDGAPVLMVNAGWDPEERLLNAFAKGRGIGDCGIAHSYAWDGTRFRLVSLEEMPDCRGSTELISRWRAEVRQTR